MHPCTREICQQAGDAAHDLLRQCPSKFCRLHPPSILPITLLAHFPLFRIQSTSTCFHSILECLSSSRPFTLLSGKRVSPQKKTFGELNGLIRFREEGGPVGRRGRGRTEGREREGLKISGEGCIDWAHNAITHTVASFPSGDGVVDNEEFEYVLSEFGLSERVARQAFTIFTEVRIGLHQKCTQYSRGMKLHCATGLICAHAPRIGPFILRMSEEDVRGEGDLVSSDDET